jgi:L-threonylcarbamoyladenylate synthase
LPEPDFRLSQAIRVIANGGVLAYPTEAVWGLGCDPWNQNAVERLLRLKARAWQKGLILAGASIEQFAWLLQDLSAAQRSRLELSWPGPTTWLVPHHGQVPEWVCGEHDTVALRVSAHPVVRRLCESFGAPIITTSANVAGTQPAVEQFQVRRYFGPGVDCLVPGALGGLQRPSTIRDLVSDEIVRPG